MSKISNLLTDFTSVSNLGNLPIRGRPQTNYLPKQDNPEGSTCYNNGKKGKMKRVDGRLTCVTSEKESDMDTELNEALKDMKEAKGLRFQSASRSQIGKQYHFSVDNAVAVAGLGKLKASPIQGIPGNWFFTLTANEENQLIDPKRMNGKLYSGVTVTAIARESQQQTASVDKPKSVRESILAMVEETKKDTASGVKENKSPDHDHLIEKGWTYRKGEGLYTHYKTKKTIKWSPSSKLHIVTSPDGSVKYHNSADAAHRNAF